MKATKSPRFSVLLFLFSSLLFIACEKDKEDTLINQHRYRFTLSRTLDLSSEIISNVNMLLFDANDKMCEALIGIDPVGNTYPVLFDKNETAKIWVVANGNGIGVDLNGVQGQSYETIAQLQTTSIDYVNTYPAMFYTGMLETATANSTDIDIAMQRSLSRIDVKIATEVEIKIDSCVISNLIDRTVLLPGAALTPTVGQLKIARFGEETFSDMNENNKEGLVYIYESRGVKPTVEFFVNIQGIHTKLVAELPATIERNKKYEVSINGRGATVFTHLAILDWEEGETTDAKPEAFTPVIDIANSLLPAYVRVSERQDTIYVPSCHTSFEIAIQAGVETEIRVEDPALVVAPLTRNTYFGSRFKVEVAQLPIDASRTLSRIYVKDKAAHQYYGHHITVVREPSRLVIDSVSAVIKQDSLLYNSYVDGALGTLSTSQMIANIKCESIDKQFNWLRFDEVEPSFYSIQGGFKPNDRDAAGQQQVSKVSFEFADGVVETYYFSRQRVAIPVVAMGGRYWGKYNMRGNSKILSDQISLDEDVDDLCTYLQNCTDEQFTYFAGAAYKGRNTTGMYFAENSFGMVSYDGFNSMSSGDIYNASNDIHCPSGYLMPSKEEYGLILPTDKTLALPSDDGKTSVTYTSSSGNEYSLRRYKRSPISMGTSSTGNLYVVEITETLSGNKLCFIDAGHQFGNASASSAQTAWGYLILACTNVNNQYCVFQNNQDKFQMQPHNSSKTRVVRAIKSSVDYIIE